MAHFGDLFKTRICRAFQQGNCDRVNCSFAHGEEELRIVGNNDRRYMGADGQGQVWDRLRRPPSPPRNVYRRRPSPHARGPASPGRPPPIRRGPPMENRNRNRSHSPMYKRRRSNSNSPSRSPRPLNGEMRQIKRVRPDHGEQDYSDVSGEDGDDIPVIPQRVASRLSPMSGGGGKDIYELQEQMSKMSAEKQELVQEVRALAAKMHSMEDSLKRKEAMVKDLLTKLTVSEEKFQRLELQLREIVTAQIKVEKSKEHYESSQAELRKRLEEAMGENQADPVMKVLGDEDMARRHPASTPKLAPGHGEGSGRVMGGRGTSPGVRSKEGLRIQESVGHEREREQDREMERGERDRDRDGEREKYRHRDRENGLRREKCGSAGGGSHGGRKHHGEDGAGQGMLRIKQDEDMGIVSIRGETLASSAVREERGRMKGKDTDHDQNREFGSAGGSTTYRAAARMKLESKIQGVGGREAGLHAEDHDLIERDIERRKEQGVSDGGHSTELLPSGQEREWGRDEKRERVRAEGTPERRDGFARKSSSAHRSEPAPHPVTNNCRREREIVRESKREGREKGDRLSSQIVSRDSKLTLQPSGERWPRQKRELKGNREQQYEGDNANDEHGDNDNEDEESDDKNGRLRRCSEYDCNQKQSDHTSDSGVEPPKKGSDADSSLQMDIVGGSPCLSQGRYSGDEDETSLGGGIEENTGVSLEQERSSP